MISHSVSGYNQANERLTKRTDSFSFEKGKPFGREMGMGSEFILLPQRKDPEMVAEEEPSSRNSKDGRE